MAPLQLAQKQVPVSSVDPPTARGGIILRLRAFRERWTASNSATLMIGCTSMIACSSGGFRRFFFAS